MVERERPSFLIGMRVWHEARQKAACFRRHPASAVRSPTQHVTILRHWFAPALPLRFVVTAPKHAPLS